ncbi:heparan-alpha-glucosaminide N-acetyltransferase domain-containing protein [Micrococcus terreus]|uniref:heparan-alpha-glucosaminide N-acetyltransferase domain-containing protein n=1 Tax=Micrococcus terreus TaxID=574650 RepID=UPI0025516E00|nr:heparan-alpha-glucosaminide N-acetyltransferase domain-containing protein [Micrococcus terreus]MDK7701193.1 heparan-alpha-glucosaminide N-acetyltransferase domain-containing protein [Micrococcus terreus]WOO97798.1 heparan-alpha-glucosaminide N-acetyltransferase domain-containing protein [Micrococcus terreus]
MNATEPRIPAPIPTPAQQVPEGDLPPGDRPRPGRRPPRVAWTGEGEPTDSEQITTSAPLRRRRRAGWGGGAVLNIPTRDGSRTRRRITGVDAARGAALIGMVAVHTLPEAAPVTGTPTLSWLLFGGHASALFAVLAGVAVAFMMGGRRPKTCRRLLLRARVGLLVRALLLLVWRLGLNALPLPVYDILPYYAVLFLFALPFTGLRMRHLIAAAVVFAVPGPWVRHLALQTFGAATLSNPTLVDLVLDPAGLLLSLLLTGVYPAVTWMAFILLGMALGRMMLQRRSVQLGLLGTGGLLMLLGNGISWLAVHAWGGSGRIVSVSHGATANSVRRAMLFGGDPALPSDSPWWQLVVGPHSNTTLSWAASAGTALVVVGGALWVSRSAGQLLWPLASLGSMTLTGYTIHSVVLASVHVDHHPWLWFWGQVVLGILLAMAWQRAVGRGPIEAAVSRLSRLGAAVLVRPEGRRSRS